MDKEHFRKLATSWRFKFYMFSRLPGAWFMGIRIHALTSEEANVHLPYRWRSQNPFRSTYFAAQIAAAEMSTGILVLQHLIGQPSCSMLVLATEGKFYKKVSETLNFTCTQGTEIQQAIERTVATGAAEELVLKSVGKLPNGEIAGEFSFKWGIKRKVS